MPTYLSVQNRVNLDCLNRMDLVQETKRAILSAIRSYENQPMWFNQTATTINCTAAQTYINLPSDYISENNLRITFQSADYHLIPRPLSDINELNVTRIRDRPTFYCQFGNRFELAPIPDSAYPVIVQYIQKLPDLSADTDVNDWLSAGEDVIVYCAAKMVSANLGRVDDAAKFQRLEQMFYTNLMQNRDMKSLKSLKPTRF